MRFRLTRRQAVASFGLACIGMTLKPPALAGGADRLQGSDQGSLDLLDLVQLAEFAGLRISGDGAHAAYVVSRPSVAKNVYECALYISPLTSAGSPRLVREFTSRNEVNPTDRRGVDHAWAPDGQQLALVRESGSELQLCVVGVDTTDVRALATVPAGTSIEGWLPDGSAVICSLLHEESAKPRGHAPGDPSFRYDGSWRVNGATPWKQPLVQNSRYEYWAVGVNGVRRALSDAQMRQWNAGKADTLELEPSGPLFPRYVRAGVRSPDSRFDAYLVDNILPETDLLPPRYRGRTLIVRSAASGRRTELLDCADLAILEDPRWSPDSSSLFVVEHGSQQSTIRRIDRRTGSSRVIFRAAAYLHGLSWSADGERFISIWESATEPPRLVCVNVTRGAVRTLHEPNSRFRGMQLPGSKVVSFKNSFGLEHAVRITLPTNYVAGMKYPLVATTYSAHSGFPRGTSGAEYPILWFARHGFVVASLRVAPDVLATSQRGHLEASLVRLRSPLETLETVVRELIQQGVVEQGHCGITGLSYGSEIVDWALWNSEVFSAAAASTCGFTPSQFFSLEDRWRDGFYALRGLPYPDDEGSAAWRRYSAALNAAHVRMPLLLQPPDEEASAVLETYHSLKYAGVPVEMHVFPNEGHVKQLPASRYWAARRNVDWMRFWLKGEEDPDPALAVQYERWRALREQ